MNKEKIGWGILGPGRIAREFAGCLKYAEGAYVAACGSRSLMRAEKFCSEFGGKAYGSYEELCNDPDVDVVYVATPHPMHEAHTVMACNAGKHVLCEKPFAVNRKQAEHMIEAAKKNHVFLQEGLWSRFFPAWQFAKEQVKSGKYGKLLQVRCQTGWGIQDGQFSPENRLMNPDLAGGSLLDGGIYSLAAMSFVREKYDMPVGFKSLMKFDTPTSVDSDTDMIMNFKDGMSAFLSSSFYRTDNSSAFVCEKGTVLIPANRNPAEVIIETFPYGRETCEFPYEGRGFQFEAESVMNCIRQGLSENPQATLEETLFLSTLSDMVRTEGGLRYPFEK